MTPNQLRETADRLIQRGMVRRAVTVLTAITTHVEASEAQRRDAMKLAARILEQHCQTAHMLQRQRENIQQQARREAARNARNATVTKSKAITPWM